MITRTSILGVRGTFRGDMSVGAIAILAILGLAALTRSIFWPLVVGISVGAFLARIQPTAKDQEPK